MIGQPVGKQQRDFRSRRKVNPRCLLWQSITNKFSRTSSVRSVHGGKMLRRRKITTKLDLLSRPRYQQSHPQNRNTLPRLVRRRQRNNSRSL